MGETLNYEMDGCEKGIDEIKESAAYKFIKDNYDIFDEFYDIQYKINDSILEIEENILKLGEIDKKRLAKKIELLKKKESELLDIIVNLDGVDNISNNERLYEIMDIIDEEKNGEEAIESEESVEGSERDFVEEDDDFEFKPDIVSKIRERIIKKEKNENSQQGGGGIQIVENEDQQRLKNIRKLLKADLNQEAGVFDPQKELLRMKLSPDRKRQTFEKFKSELGEQLLGMSKINSFLENEILENENVDLESVHAKFEEKAGEYKLSRWQKETYRNVFSVLQKSREEVKKDWENYKSMTGAEVVEAITCSGYVCKGKIELENHSFSIIVNMYDNHDFVKIYSIVTGKEKNTGKDKYTALIGGFHKMGYIFLNLSSEENLKEKDSTLVHEIKHCINEIVDRGLKENVLANYYDDKIKIENIEQYFECELDVTLWQAKDEILAYFKDGKDVDDIKALILHEGGPYDFLDYERYKKRTELEDNDNKEEDKILEKYNSREIKREFDKWKLKYKNVVIESLDLLEDLEMFGFSRSEIIGIFQTDPLIRWSKIHGRLEKNPRFLQEKRENIEKQLSKYRGQIESLSQELEQYRRDTPWIARMMSKLKYNLPSYFANRFPRETYKGLELVYALKGAQEKKVILEKFLSKA